MTWKPDKELVNMARLSPKKFGKAIRRRNSIALKHLNRMAAELKKHKCKACLDWVVKLGCPHCQLHSMDTCRGCLWQNLYGGTLACVYVPFDEQILDDVRNEDRMVQVAFTASSVELRVRIPLDANENWNQFNYQLKECRKFLKGHITWSKLPCWGKDY